MTTNTTNTTNTHFCTKKKILKTAFVSDWQPSPCQDGRHGQANKTGQAGLPHPCPGTQEGNFGQRIAH